MLKLNLGCGGDIREGYCNVDVSAHEGVNVVQDLNIHPWPAWQVSSVDEIVAVDVLEHLDNFLDFFNECHDILRDGCDITVQVPHSTSRNYWIDPTHRRAYDERSFDYLDDATELGQRYGKYYTDKRWSIVTVERNYIDGNITAVIRARKSIDKPAYMKALEPAVPTTPIDMLATAQKIANELLGMPKEDQYAELLRILHHNAIMHSLVVATMEKTKKEQQ